VIRQDRPSTARPDLWRTIELVAGAGTVAVLTFAYVLGVGRMLGPAEYADFSAAMSMFYFVAVALSPLAPTTARLVACYVVRGEKHRAGMLQGALRRIVLRWSLFAAIPLLLALVPISRAFHFASPATLAITFASTAVFTAVNIRRGVLQGLGRFREHNVSTIVEAALRLAGAVAILMYVPTPTGALVSYLAALIVADLLLRGRVAEPAERDVDWTEVKRLAAPMFIAMIGVAVFQSADVLAVKRWFTAAEAGQYGAASTLARSISVLFVPIYTVAGPLLTHLHERGESLLPATLRLCGYFVALAALPAALFALAGETVVAALYGAAFRAAGPMLARMSGVAVVTYVSLIIGQALITVGDRRFGRIYLAFAIAQVIALVLARGSIDAIILSLYLVQGGLMIVMFVVMMGLRAGKQGC
jgi:O-antigen/teichoic acid export membrane protein